MTPTAHEAANIFPLDEENLDSLAEDIRERGQLVPVELLGGKVIDGRRRLLACEKVGVKPKFREVTVEDPIAYVLALNLHRRHLTTSQLAMVGAEAKEMYAKQAKERQKASGHNKEKPLVVDRGPQPLFNGGKARDKAGERVGVSGKSIDRAAKVLEQGTPKLIAAVKDDKISVKEAARISTQPPEEQDEFVDNAQDRPRRKKEEDDETPGPNDGKLAGVGVIKAHEAINILIRIPKNDQLRKRGFQIVTDWIRRNP